MPTPLTASVLYDLVMRPNWVTMDLNGDKRCRDLRVATEASEIRI
jgi:hypothetical protein